MSTWTPEAIRTLGPTTDLPTLASILDCSRWKAYQMARTGEWDKVGVKIVRLGSRYRVIVASILAVIGHADGAPAVTGARTAASPAMRAPSARVAGDAGVSRNSAKRPAAGPYPQR